MSQLTRFFSGTSPSLVDGVVEQSRRYQGFFDRQRPRSVSVVDAIEPNAAVRKEECTQSMKCM
jgi:hypothetical protein